MKRLHIQLITITTLVILTALALAGCGDGGSAPEPTSAPSTPMAPPTPVASPTSASPTPEPRRTGIEKIDAALDAFEARSLDELIALMLFAPEACEPPAQGAGGPPACDPNQPAGTPVNVVPMASCEGYWVSDAGIRQFLYPMLQRQIRVYAVYRADERLFDRHGAYSVIIEVTGGEQGPMAHDVIMTEDGIVGIDQGCGQNAEQLVDFHRLTDAIIAPPEVRTS